MNSEGLLPVVKVPADHMRQALACLWGADGGLSGWWPFLGWGAGWSGIIMTYGFGGLLIAGVVFVIRRLALAWKASSANTSPSQVVEILEWRDAKARGIRDDEMSDAMRHMGTGIYTCTEETRKCYKNFLS